MLALSGNIAAQNVGDIFILDDFGESEIGFTPQQLINRFPHQFDQASFGLHGFDFLGVIVQQRLILVLLDHLHPQPRPICTNTWSKMRPDNNIADHKSLFVLPKLFAGGVYLASHCFTGISINLTRTKPKA